MRAVFPAISRRSIRFPKATDAIVVHLIVHTIDRMQQLV
jgi:hypothetical protein